MGLSPRNTTLLVFVALIAIALLSTYPSIFRALCGDIPGYFSKPHNRSRVESTPPTGTRANFSWDSLPPSDHLAWHDCYSEYQCARLSVPLNHSDPSGEKASIAMTRIPSPLPVDSPWYRGPILFNPGGPGGSGVDLVVEEGKALSMIVGPQFDVLGFDPRGIGYSTPRVSFFETAAERALWGFGGLHVVDASTGGVAREWARSKVVNGLARERQLNVIRHINTDQTARDMLRIIEAHGRVKLQYWGFSYGTILGATFAPDFRPNHSWVIFG